MPGPDGLAPMVRCRSARTVGAVVGVLLVPLLEVAAGNDVDDLAQGYSNDFELIEPGATAALRSGAGTEQSWPVWIRTVGADDERTFVRMAVE